MHQIQDPMPFHPDQHEAGSEADGQVSFIFSGSRNGKALPLTTSPTDLIRDKRIEELEKRLRSMEDLMTRPVLNQKSDLNDAGSDSGSGGLGASPFSEQSENGTSASSVNLDPIPTITRGDSEASDFSLLSLEGKCRSATQLSDLIYLSISFCSG